MAHLYRQDRSLLTTLHSAQRKENSTSQDSSVKLCTSANSSLEEANVKPKKLAFALPVQDPVKFDFNSTTDAEFDDWVIITKDEVPKDRVKSRGLAMFCPKRTTLDLETTKTPSLDPAEEESDSSNFDVSDYELDDDAPRKRRKSIVDAKPVD
ncbi:Protein of unknown function [Pyronema omphalodes CBS 100304]|uniref:Uncharacterized protein n=1 Tax=Pyronema omphalodes (strain CBS 100304) TaxID=1076935 RepID=U4KWU2_PYROM|nr:Protein of unknown function [Pyronema omphalodes CBS 100304]